MASPLPDNLSSDCDCPARPGERPHAHILDCPLAPPRQTPRIASTPIIAPEQVGPEPNHRTHWLVGVYADAEMAAIIASNTQDSAITSTGTYTHLVWKEKK